MDKDSALANPETFKKSLSLANEAIQRMQSHQVPPVPVHYAVWYTHAAGENEALSKAIETLDLSDPDRASAGTSALYDEYLSPQTDASRVQETGLRIEKELGEVLAVLATATGDAEQFQTALQSNLAELASDQGLDMIKTVIRSLVDEAGKIQTSNLELRRQLEASTSEIVNLRENLADMRREVLTDSLTQIANRKMLDLTLKQEIEMAAAQGSALAVVMTDIDHFKKFNDTFGHQVGDQVLRLVAKILQKNVRDGELAARYGGEEFALVLPGCSLEEARSICDRIRQIVSTRQLRDRTNGKSMGTITLSLGVSAYRAGDTADGLVERADACLYEAKRSGRNRTVVEADIDDAAMTA